MRSWDTKTYATRGRIGRAPYGKKLALLGLVTVTLLVGGAVLALPMHTVNPNPHPEAAISLNTGTSVHVQSAVTPEIKVTSEASTDTPTRSLTVNGQTISMPANGSTNQVVSSDTGDVNVHTNSSSGTSTNSSSSSLSIEVHGTGNVSTKSEITGGTSTVNILTR